MASLKVLGPARWDMTFESSFNLSNMKEARPFCFKQWAATKKCTDQWGAKGVGFPSPSCAKGLMMGLKDRDEMAGRLLPRKWMKLRE
jgi:hypothetical protein